jgi:hypothetical protein
VKQTAERYQTIIRYLLNEMPAEDQARFEESYLKDDSLFEDVQAIEEELIDDYVKGTLYGRQRRNFERHYLATEQHLARIENARRLVRMSSLKSQSQVVTAGRIRNQIFSLRSRFRLLVNQRLTPAWGMTVALVGLLAAGLGIELVRVRRQLAAASAERTALIRRAEESEQALAYERKQNLVRREKLENLNKQPDKLEPKSAKPRESKNNIVFLALAPGVRKNNKLKKAVISAHTSFVELLIDLEEQEATNPRGYRVAVKTIGGNREIWGEEGLSLQQRKSAQYIVVRVPARRFRATGVEDFTLTLSALAEAGGDYEELEGYYFQVISK